MTKATPFFLFGSLVFGAALTGCNNDPVEITTVSETGLVVTETADGARGTFQDGEMYAEFSTRMDGDVLDIVVRFNGMTLTYLADFHTKVIEYDGYADDGSETQMTTEDRDLLAALEIALDDLGGDISVELKKLRSMVDTYQEFPSSKSLTGHAQVPFDYDRHTPDDSFWWSGYSICDHMNGYTSAVHPSSHHDFNWTTDQRTLTYSYVSMHSGQCGGSYDDTKFWRPTADYYLVFGGDDDNPVWQYYSTTGWQCMEPDHLTRWNGGSGWNGSYSSLTSDVEYGFGLCFGRCGGGCGSATQFTVDCLNHDSCVRIGHDTAATIACDAIFDSTIDDWTFAPDC